MKTWLTVLLAVSAPALLLGDQQTPGWTKDPDTAVDSARIWAIVGQLIAPDATPGALDTAPPGSFGTGTAGTANTWKSDKGPLENRMGLCKP